MATTLTRRAPVESAGNTLGVLTGRLAAVLRLALLATPLFAICLTLSISSSLIFTMLIESFRDSWELKSTAP